MAGLANFGGKKAAPFGKGGKRRIAKAMLKKHGERMAKQAKGKAKKSADLANVDLSVLSAADRKALPPSAFVFPSKRAYPIHDLAHAKDALARSSGKPEAAAVRAAVYKRFPALRKG